MITRARLTILMASVLANPWPVLGGPFYTNDFQGTVGNEWSKKTVAVTPVGNRRFLGEFCNDSATLILQNMPSHTQVTVSFDLFVLRSWDGIGAELPVYAPGPDIWSLKMDGSTLLRTTFDNHYFAPYKPYHKQSFPGLYPGGNSSPQTGAKETNMLGYTFTFSGVGTMPADSVYRLDFSFVHSASALILEFSASGLQGLADESWGLDNLTVELDSGQTTVSPPVVSTQEATDPGPTGATLHGWLSSDGGEGCECWFRYWSWGVSGDEKRTASILNCRSGAIPPQRVDCLLPGKYFFQAVARNSKGQVYGEMMSFLTDSTGTWDTAHFSITYHTEGKNAVSFEDKNSNCIPDFVDDVGRALEEAYYQICEVWKFKEGVSWLSSKYCVEIKDIEGIPGRLLNKTFGHSVSEVNSRLSRNECRQEFGSLDIDYGAILNVCAHEYFHASQAASGWFVGDLPYGITEGSAELIGYLTSSNYGTSKGRTIDDFKGYLTDPSKSLFSGQPNEGKNGTLFWYFVYELSGKNIDIIKSYWNNPVSSLTWRKRFDSVLSRSGHTFESAFKLFGEKNYYWEYSFHLPRPASDYLPVLRIIDIRSEPRLDGGVAGVSNIDVTPVHRGIGGIDCVDPLDPWATRYYRITGDHGLVGIELKSGSVARIYPNGNATGIPLESGKSLLVAGSNTVVMVNALLFCGYSIVFWAEPQGYTTTSIVYPLKPQSHYSKIDTTVSQVLFRLLWPGSNLDLTLTSPSGMTIDPAYVAHNPNVTYVEKGTEEYYIIENPEPGQWQMNIVPVEVPVEGENYTITADLTTNLILTLSSDKGAYNLNDPIALRAELVYDGHSYSDANVVAQIQGPQGTETITLFDDGLHNDANSGDGIYVNTYTNTSIAGESKITATASGLNPFSEPFVRQMNRTIFVQDLPDLVPTDLTIDYNPMDGDATLATHIQNNGSKDANGVVMTFFDVNDSNTVQIGDDITIDRLGSHEAREVSVNWDIPNGAHNVIVVVDYLNTVPESDETNNYLSRPFCAEWESFGDLNHDCIVNFLDLALIGNEWLARCSGPDWCGAADLDQDGSVAGPDLSVLADNWLHGQENPPVVITPIALWKFDETSGNKAADSAGANPGTVNGASWTTGKIGGALSFDGVDDYVDCGKSPLLAPEMLTAAFWVYREPVSGFGVKYAVYKGGSGLFDRDYSIGLFTGGAVEFSFGNDNSSYLTVLSQTKVNTQEWTHVAVTRDGSRAAVYLNGNLDVGKEYVFAPVDKGHPLSVGSMGGKSLPFKGKIDDLRIYDQALSDKKIKGLFEEALK